MQNTTISISIETKNKIQELGHKGETYDNIIKRLYQSAKERQLQELLMDTSDSVSAKEALERARKRWLKSS